MAKFQEFGSFGELQSHFEEQEAREKEDLQNEIKEALEGRLNTFPSGNFKTQIEGLESVSITRPDAKPGQEVTNLNIMPFWQNGERHSTFSLNAKGELTGKIPPALEKLGITKEQISRDVLHTIKTIDLDFFTHVDEKILPPGEWEKGLEKEKPKGVEARPRVVDPKRLEFMRNQEDVLFGFDGINSGFRGYYGFVFKNFLALENAKTGNATYFFKFSEPINVDPSVYRLPPSKRIPEPQRAEILDKVWKPIAGQSKSKSLEAGAVSYWHPKVSDEEWEVKMSQKLAEIRA